MDLPSDVTPSVDIGEVGSMLRAKRGSVFGVCALSRHPLHPSHDRALAQKIQQLSGPEVVQSHLLTFRLRLDAMAWYHLEHLCN